MDSFELIINLTIIGLLIPTIVFAYRLNKNLSMLRQNQKVWLSWCSRSTKPLSKPKIPFRSSNRLPNIPRKALKEVVDSAKTLKDDLTFINERADNLADRLEIMIKDGRSIKEEKPAAGLFGAKKASVKARDDVEDFAVSDSRSEAEMELLKALRSIK